MRAHTRMYTQKICMHIKYSLCKVADESAEIFNMSEVFPVFPTHLHTAFSLCV